MEKHPFTYDNLNNIKEKALFKVRQENGESQSIMKIRKPLFSLAFAAVIFLSLTFAVMAAIEAIDMSDIYKSYLGQGSEDAGFTINDTFTSDGIELHLLSSVVDGNNGYIFFTLTDLEGDRLGEDIGWGYTDVDFNKLFKGSLADCSVEPLSYDETKKMITAVIKISATKSISLNDAMTLTVGNLETGVRHHSNFDTGVNLHKLISESGKVKTTLEYGRNVNGWGAPIGNDLTEKQVREQELLEVNAFNIEINGIDWAVISNMGFVDGKFHIQYKYNENRSGFNGGYFELHNENGDIIPSVYSFSFSAGGNQYEEYTYDISEIDELKLLSLICMFSTSKGKIEGPWQLSFRVGAVAEEKSIKLDNLESTEFEKVQISVSSISTTLEFKTDNKKDDESLNSINEIYNSINYLRLKDGTTVELKVHSASLDHERNKGEVIFSNMFFDISDLSSIIINGYEYAFE